MPGDPKPLQIPRGPGPERRALATLVSGALVALASACSDATEPSIPTSVELAPTGVVLEFLGQSVQLTGTIRDQSGRALPGAPRVWSSLDEAVATVSRTGLITATGRGSTRVVLTSEGVSSSIAVTVDPAATGFSLSVESWSFDLLGDTLRILATAVDAGGSTVEDALVAWVSSDPSVASVDGAGLVTAMGPGTAWVRAGTQSLADSVEIHVEPAVDLVPSVVLVDTAIVASELDLGAVVEDLLGAPYPGALVTWSVEPGSGAITSAPETPSDNAGRVSAVWTLGTTPGEQRAFASVKSRGETVTVGFAVIAVPGPAASISMVADSVLLSARGESAQLAPAFLDAWGNPTSGEGVVWSSRNPGVASASPGGLVTGSGSGATWVAATLGEPLDSVLVTVVPRGAITLTFDDGWRSVYDNAWPVLQEFPWVRANVAVYTRAVGWPGYLSEAQLAEFHDRGWSMVSHTVSHDSLSTLPPDVLDFELRASQEWLLSRGYRGTNVLVAPYHDFTDAERAAASRYYTAARGRSATETSPETLVEWMPAQPYHLTGLEADLLPYTTAAGRDHLREVLRRAMDEGRFVDLFFHKVPPESVDAFRAVLDVLREFRDRVLPYHELYPLAPRLVS